MSHVANIILTTAIGEESKAQQVIDYLDNKHNIKDSLVELTNLAGGNKHMECRVYLGAINCLNIDAFLKHAGSILWECETKLLIRDEHDWDFTVHQLKGPVY